MPRTHSHSAIRLLNPIAASLLIAGQAVAQQSVLEEVVVTAQKRAQSIQDVPISITAFSGEFLEDTGVLTIEDVSRMTPNFAISTSAQPANNRITIRGIGSVGNNAIESSVGVFVDGVYYPRPGSVIGMLHDINTFEVLRGPQGTLYGRNTVAGALNITTNSPSQEPEAIIEVGAGEYSAWELGGVISGPLGENVAGRLAIKYADRDGYGENLYDGKDFGARDDLVARGKLQIDASEKLSLLLTADISELNVGGNAIEVLNSTVTDAYVARSTAFFGDSPVTSDSYDWKINQRHRDDISDEQQGLALDINYEFSNGVNLRSITSYRDWDANAENIDVRYPAELLPASTNYETDTVSQELQLISPGGETIDWIAGLYYYQEDYDINEIRSAGADYCVPTLENLAGPGLAALCLANEQEQAIVTDFSQELESIAVYGQATWNINDAWNVTLGLRWSDDQKDGDFVDQVNNPGGGLFRASETTLGMKRDDSKTTGLLNVNWNISDDAMLFATYSTGYKSGGFNSQGGRDPLGADRRVFAPEESTNIELGVKSTLLDGKMTANATLYRTDLDDFQDRAFDGLSFVVINAGKLRQQGVEFDVNWVPVEQLRIVAGASYLDSEYREFEGAPPLPGGTPQDLTGERRNNSPKWQTSLNADWTQAFANNLEWFVGAGWSWVDEQNVGASSNNNPQSVQDAYSIVNARVGIRSAEDTWNVTLFGNNLTDEDYCQTMFDQGFGGPLGAIDRVNNTAVQRCALGSPKHWMVRASYRF